MKKRRDPFTFHAGAFFAGHLREVLLSLDEGQARVGLQQENKLVN